MRSCLYNAIHVVTIITMYSRAGAYEKLHRLLHHYSYLLNAYMTPSIISLILYDKGSGDLMSCYRYIHMTARIPGEDIDKLESYEHEKPRHTVICR